MMERLLERNLSIKAFSVFLAIILWFLVMDQQNPEQPQPVKGLPVEFVNLSPDLVALETLPSSVNLTVRGPRRLLERLDKGAFKATVDLTDADIGERSYPVNISVPEGIRLDEATPAEVIVRVDALARKTFPVEVSLIGNTQVDFRAGKPEVSPAQVEVSGPGTRVQAVARVVVEIDLADTAVDLVTNAPFKILNAQGKEIKGLTITPQMAQVTIPLEKLPPAKVVSVRPNVEGQPAPGYRIGAIQVEPWKVAVRGPQARLDGIEAVYTAPIDINGARDTLQVEAELVVPDGLLVADPARVMVTVPIKENVVQRTLEQVPVAVRRLNPQLEAQLESGFVAITLEGPQRLMDLLKVEDIDLYIEARGLGEGEHHLEIQAVVPYGVRVVETKPATILVTLRSVK